MKTRLSGALGEAGAAELAGAFIEDTCGLVSAARDVTPILVLDGAMGALSGLPSAVQVWEQGSGDLGARLERALCRALMSHDAVIALGADSPGLPAELLTQVRHALKLTEAAMGPAEDGGFYALGLRRCPKELFRGLPWSRPDTGTAMLSRLRQAGLQPRVTDTWFDIDTPADLSRLEALLSRRALFAARTRACLQTLQRRPSPDERISVSVIIPTWNESARIERRLEELRQLRQCSGEAFIRDVCVADGGSTDGTRALSRGFTGVRVLDGARGRAKQMNAGARFAAGDVLLFLHADVSLPEDALEQVARALSGPSVVAGAFRTRTVADLPPAGPGRGSSRLFRRALFLADIRSRYSRRPYGDQALFVRGAVFRHLGGFPDQALMEDLEMSRKLAREGRIHTARSCVRVSGRRFLERPLFYTFLVNVYPMLYALGVPPERLAVLYGNPR